LTNTAEFEIKFQNDIVKLRMDGVMISTPSGSTGLSYQLVDQYCMKVWMC